jgi:DNA-directed RNA polymerase subunit RPC12/RpoP
MIDLCKCVKCDKEVETLMTFRINGIETDKIYMCEKCMLEWFNEMAKKRGVE